MLAIGAMLLTPLTDEYFPEMPAKTYLAVAYGLLWIAAALTVYTGVIYFRGGIAPYPPGTDAAAGILSFGTEALTAVRISIHQSFGERTGLEASLTPISLTGVTSAAVPVRGTFAKNRSALPA